MSLGANDEMIRIIGAIYWYTVEFGLCKEKDQMKFYGAGVASSIAEIENIQNVKDLRLLDLWKEYPDHHGVLVSDLQKFYYYIEDFDNLKDQLDYLSK